MLKNYKAIILAGGRGSRYNLRNKNKFLKPLVKINKLPVLERVIRIYKSQGIKKFIILGGYKYESLKIFSKKISKKYTNLEIKTVFTGINTNTAGRLLKIKSLIKNEIFFFTYGDSIANFNLKKALKKKNKKNFTISVFNYSLPYGELEIRAEILKKINEKNKNLYINAGFYILDSDVFKYIKNFKESFEKTTINKILKMKKKKISIVKLTKWHPMDDHGDRIRIEKFLKQNEKIFK